VGIGQRAIKGTPDTRRSTFSPEFPRKILHIGTSMVSIGGHSKMLRRWINEDLNRSHSLVLTRQCPNPIPKELSDAVSNSHGEIYTLNNRIGGIISWAKQLSKLASAFDLVVLHIHNYDVIPIIAFANKEQSPPIMFLDHADHIFWLGASISDLVISLRESGMEIVRQRRGIEEKRNVLLPIKLEPIHRKISRIEAKRQLNLPDDSILILSIARGVKYKTINGISFADPETYPVSSFTGSKILSYAVNAAGVTDIHLGFGISYLNIENTGDILFKNDWDTDTFIHDHGDFDNLRIKISTGFYKFNISEEYGNGWIATSPTYLHPILDYQKINTST
jgi:hypothetical protein